MKTPQPKTRNSFFLLLLLLLLATGGGHGQGVTQLADWHAYRDNPWPAPVLMVSPSDTATYTAVAKYTKLGPVLPNNQQPQTLRGIGTVQAYWPTTTGLPATPFVEIRRQGVVAFIVNMYVDKNPTNITSPKALTVVYPSPTVAYAPVTAESVWFDLMDLLFR